jgi:hypothetical protein
MKLDNLDITNISHYGDILAIPFFLLLIIYFYNKKNKNCIEYLLLLFGIGGFILDIFYTYIFFKQQDKKLA